VAGQEPAAAPESYRQVRIADGGWTNNVEQNGIAVVVLEAVRLHATIRLLALPLIYESMKNGEIDFFTGRSPDGTILKNLEFSLESEMMTGS